jgi:hypothetical protein
LSPFISKEDPQLLLDEIFFGSAGILIDAKPVL